MVGGEKSLPRVHESTFLLCPTGVERRHVIVRVIKVVLGITIHDRLEKGKMRHSLQAASGDEHATTVFSTYLMRLATSDFRRLQVR
jgi:hypothetical protein